MHTIKDHFIILFISFIIVVLLIDRNNYFLSPLLFHIFFNILLFIVCYYLSNTKLFSLTSKKLSKYDRYEFLEYKILYKDNTVRNIYVRPYSSSYWYELYYPLTISRNSSYSSVKEFISSHGQVMSLQKCMEKQKYKDTVDWFHVFSMILFWIFEIYYWMVVIGSDK